MYLFWLLRHRFDKHVSRNTETIMHLIYMSVAGIVTWCVNEKNIACPIWYNPRGWHSYSTKCITFKHNIIVSTLQTLYELLCESKCYNWSILQSKKTVHYGKKKINLLAQKRYSSLIKPRIKISPEKFLTLINQPWNSGK